MRDREDAMYEQAKTESRKKEHDQNRTRVGEILQFLERTKEDIQNIIAEVVDEEEG